MNPLTPALSPFEGERENGRQPTGAAGKPVVVCSDRLNAGRRIQSRSDVIKPSPAFPSPWGEGKGEGNVSAVAETQLSPLTPALSPSAVERENRRQLPSESKP